jgi:glycosyltransferase involved in cell wall biosynthesis
MKRLKIVYAIQNVGLDLDEPVGDAVPVIATIRGLHRQGHSVSVWALSGVRVLERLVADEDPARARSAPLGISRWWLFRKFEGLLRRVQRWLRLPYFALFDNLRFYEAMLRLGREADLVHEHNGLFSIGAALACRRLAKPYILTFSADAIMERDLIGQPLKGPHLRAAKMAAAFTYRQARAILTVSNAAKTHLIENWQVDPDKIWVMPNGVDLALFGASPNVIARRAELGWQDQHVIGFVGGFQPWHGLEILLQAFADLRRAGQNVKLLLVGDGRHRPVLDQLIQRLSLQSDVHITGLIPPAEVPAWMAVMDSATLPYPKLPSEMWFSPLKLYEYMAAGKAIVASRSGQIAEVLSDAETGLLVQPGDPLELQAALARLIANPELASSLGQAARRLANERHSWGRYVEKLENVYEFALGFG